jgi:hypothetical protein
MEVNMKRILVLLLTLAFILTSISYANAVVLFEDNFDDGNLDGWIHIPDSDGDTHGIWSVVGGVAQFSLDPSLDDGGFLRVDGFVMPDSFVLEFDAITLTNNSNGQMHISAYMYFKDHDNHVIGVLRQGPGIDHLILIEEIGGTRYGSPDHETTLVFLPYSTDEFQWHHHKYIKEGNSVSFYFDDDLKYSTELPEPISNNGLVLFANSGTHQFDNVILTTPSVQITSVSVDLETYQRRDPITYTIGYTIADGIPGATYDLKTIVKPRFGKNCRKEPPKTGIKGTAKAFVYELEDGDYLLTIDYRPNNSTKHYIIPKCAKEEKHITVKYKLKLYKAGTTEYVTSDSHIEEDQFFIESSVSHNSCAACHL